MKKSDIVAQKILEKISSGEIDVGDRLPSETVLAKTYEVSRTTLREAFKKLEQFGAVESKRGSGTYVSNTFSEDAKDNGELSGNKSLSMNLAIDAIKGMLNINNYKATHYLDARRTVEFSAVDLAVVVMDDENFRALNSNIEESESPDCSIERYRELDCLFHRELVKSAKNDFLLIFWMILEPCLREQVLRIVDTPVISANSKSKHRRIFEALLKRDANEAKSMLEEHYSTILGRFFLKATQVVADDEKKS